MVEQLTGGFGLASWIFTLWDVRYARHVADLALWLQPILLVFTGLEI